VSILSRILKRSEDHPACLVAAYLRENEVPFAAHHHPAAYTAQHLAQVEHVPGKMVAKVVVAFANEQMLMLALPAPVRVNLLKLTELLGTEDVRLAREAEFAAVFSDCEVGAMPPFGNLYNLPVIVEQTLAKDQQIVFQAGTHTDTIEMSYLDFEQLVRPRIADFAYRPNACAAA